MYISRGFVTPGIHYYICPVKNIVHQNPSIVFLEFPLEGISEGQSPPNETLLIVVFVQALTINDLQHVYEKLHESASPHWFNLGLALGLTHPVLTNINSEHRGNNVSCLREMLAKLLSTQHVTWSLLSDGLKKPTVELINLADSITGNYFHFRAFFYSPVSFLDIIDYHENCKLSF